MSTPFDITSLLPSKAKTWVGLIGSLLTFVVPFVLSMETYLPPQWTAVIGVVLAVLTALGVYHAPYKPQGTVLAPDTPAVAAASVPKATPPDETGVYKNPWKG